MADEPTPTPEGGDGDTTPEKTFTQEQLNRIVEERLARERQKYADYDDLKAKAAEFDKLEESKKSEEQKLLERIEAAEKRAQEAEKAVKEAELKALRSEIKVKFGLTDAQAARLQGDTLEELEADAKEVFGEPKKEEELEDKPTPGSSRPREALIPGASNPDDKGFDGAAVAEKILSSNRI